MTLSVGSYDNVNDIGELESNISCLMNQNITADVEKYIKKNCGFISFSTNKRRYRKYLNPRYGYLIPSMWGIYADKSKGACLIIDEQALKAVNADSLSHALWYNFLNVKYKRFQGHKIVSIQDTPEFITHNLQTHLLGQKHISWAFEQERRLIGVGLPSSLSLQDSVIVGIIMGKFVSPQQKNHLNSILNNPKEACYNLDKRIFVRQEILGANMYTTEMGNYFNSSI